MVMFLGWLAGRLPGMIGLAQPLSLMLQLTELWHLKA
jgi:hypothetical protein